MLNFDAGRHAPYFSSRFVWVDLLHHSSTNELLVAFSHNFNSDCMIFLHIVTRAIFAKGNYISAINKRNRSILFTRRCLEGVEGILPIEKEIGRFFFGSLFIFHYQFHEIASFLCVLERYWI